MKKFLSVSAAAIAGIAAAAIVDDDFRGALIDTAKTVRGTIKEKLGFDEPVKAEPDEEPEGPAESESTDEVSTDTVIGVDHDHDIIGYDSPAPSTTAEASDSFDLK